MNDRKEAKRLARFELNIKQALAASRVMGSSRLFSSNPFQAMGEIVALTGVVSTLEPDWSREAGWAQSLFPRLSGSHYGWILAMDLAPVIQMGYSERNVNECARPLESAMVWGRQVATGDADAPYLEEVARKIGEPLLKAFMTKTGADGLGLEQVSTRAEDLLIGAATFATGISDPEAALKSLKEMQLSALVELIAAGIATHLYRVGEIDFKLIGRWAEISTALRPRTKCGWFLKSWMEAGRSEGSVVGPIAALEALHKGWETTYNPDFGPLAQQIIQIAGNVQSALLRVSELEVEDPVT